MPTFHFGFGSPSKGKVLGPFSDAVKDSLVFGEILGRGHIGVVRLCVHAASGERLACKTISKSRLTSWEEQEEVRREVVIMRHLGTHPNIVVLKGAYEDGTHVHLAVEECRGGELFHAISSRGPFTEVQAAKVLQGIAKGVAHCHARGVLHRDLKPENVLLVEPPCEQEGHMPQVKLADFGLSLLVGEGELVEGIAGSPYYLAPEVLGGRYGHKADVWSMGVILFMMLSQTAPFYGETDAEILDSIRQAEFEFVSPAWADVSETAKKLVRQMLLRDPTLRPTARQVAEHPWVTQEAELARSQAVDCKTCSMGMTSGDSPSSDTQARDPRVGELDEREAVLREAEVSDARASSLLSPGDAASDSELGPPRHSLRRCTGSFGDSLPQIASVSAWLSPQARRPPAWGSDGGDGLLGGLIGLLRGKRLRGDATTQMNTEEMMSFLSLSGKDFQAAEQCMSACPKGAAGWEEQVPGMMDWVFGF